MTLDYDLTDTDRVSPELAARLKWFPDVGIRLRDDLEPGPRMEGFRPVEDLVWSLTGVITESSASRRTLCANVPMDAVGRLSRHPDVAMAPLLERGARLGGTAP
jgi:hypothetical protein